MRYYAHATRFESAEKAALKLSARRTGQSINQLIVSCVRRSLPEVTAELSQHRGRITNVDPLPKEVLERIYSRPEDAEDEAVTRKFMNAQAFEGED